MNPPTDFALSCSQKAAACIDSSDVGLENEVSRRLDKLREKLFASLRAGRIPDTKIDTSSCSLEMSLIIAV